MLSILSQLAPGLLRQRQCIRLALLAVCDLPPASTPLPTILI
jgi:hypothetical protein